MSPAGDDNIIRVQLRNPEQVEPPPPPVSQMSAFLAAPRVPPPETRGISFSVEIRNGGAADALLRNPLDGLVPLVRDKAGWPLRLPPGPEARATTNYQGVFTQVLPYTVAAILRSDGEDLRPLQNADAWPIAAGRSVTIYLRLERGALHGDDSPEPGPIPPGAYELRVILALIAEYPVYSRLVVRSEIIPVQAA